MVTYEWDVETVAAKNFKGYLDLEDYAPGDIIDHDFFATLQEAVDWASLDIPHDAFARRFAHVRSTGDDESGLTGRLWAYVEDGDFERGEFQDAGADGPIYPGVKIPRRFIKELDRLPRID